MFKRLLLSLLCVTIFSAAYAREYIPQFDVIMRVNTDGSAQVTEEISIIAEHNQIRRGIYRDLPNKMGEKVHDFDLSMDGRIHPLFTENKGTMKRINFGNNDYIERGAHTYRFTYTIDNVVRLFRGHDEVYWNVTGSEWSFPIESASFQLLLPGETEVDFNNISSYVGRSGTKGVSAQANGLFFQAQHISPGSDFTVAVPFKKGIITPTNSYYLRYLTLALLIGGLILLWLYYYWSWNRVGRDPKARVLVQYEPPEGFSAVKMLYVYTMGTADSYWLPTTVVSLAMKDALSIEHETGFLGSKTFLKRKNGLTSALLAMEEAFVYPALFRGEQKIKLSERKNAEVFQKIRQELQAVLQKETDSYFTNNTWYNLPTFIYLALGCGLVSQWQSEVFVFSMFFLVFLVLLTHSLLQKRITLSQKLLPMLWISAIAISVIIPLLSNHWMGFAYALLCVAAIAGGFFMQWIKAYTVFGREVMDHIEGFKKYMEVGEGGRVAASNPTDALRIFCDYLPYAYALGIESKWMKLFEKQFPTQEITRTLSARGFRGISPSNFTHTMNTAFSSLSSGARGGGHAGGGSGGGGGGGR
ncbi:MAG: DUF2207 domain-containing protein [Elusimicrobiaceae bacterium]|nr:DUF2207 domain-containing protein [Elusimicrobiaceae bacterium]